MTDASDPTVPAAVLSGAAAGRPARRHGTGSVEQLLALQRLGTVMTPDRERPEEAWGVLNPASARSRDGTLYLFPRVVAAGNYSRIALARVTVDTAGTPAGVERLALALEPQESYEFTGPGAGGAEDPRVSYLPPLDAYIMTYTALGPLGPRIALAVSQDLRSWTRLGLLRFAATAGLDLNRYSNKDCVIFPLPVLDPTGRPAFAVLHRPHYGVPRADGTSVWEVPPGITDPRPSIWISYAPVDRVARDLRELTAVSHHQLLAQPSGSWEDHHIGAGAPPILSEEGWLLYYHGVLGGASAGQHATPGGLVYQSGVMLLDRHDPRRVLYRSSTPVLLPQEPDERVGMVPNVVFPTAVDVRGQHVDVYYGAADARIAAATTRITSSLLLAPSAPPGPDVWPRLRVPHRRAGARSQAAHQGHVVPTGTMSRDGHEAQDDVAADTATPLLTVNALELAVAGSERLRPPYERILVALDGSHLAERVLASIEPLARQFGSRVTLLRVVTTVQAHLTAGAGTGATSTDQTANDVALIPDDAARQEAAGYLTSVRQRLAAQGWMVEMECWEGAASVVILRRARQLGVSLIALTTHGRTGIDRLLLGSVAEDIVRQAPCPVHLVRVRSGH